MTFQQYFGYSVNCNSSNVALSYSLMEKHFLYPIKYGTYQKQSNVLLLFQWECKTDMDNKYRFGTIEVVCEGYDYPDDQYILKGSCGV